MKPDRSLPCALAIAFTVGASSAAPADTNAIVAKPAASVSQDASPIPQSVFEVAPGLKDPFFPKSTRGVVKEQAEPLKTTTSPSELASLLTLNGISGPQSRRLAILNGRTMANGESFEFTTLRGKVKVRCVEIRSTSVLIAVGEEENRVEIRLRD